MSDGLQADAIQEIERLVGPHFETVKVEGVPDRRFSSQQMYEMDTKAPQPDKIKVSTLQAVVDLLKSGIEEYGADKVLVRVESPTEVRVESRHFDPWNRRDMLIYAATTPRLFSFDQFMKQEAFIIAVQAAFVDNDAQRELLALVSSLASEDRLQVEDSGVNQMVTAKTGVAMLTTLPVKPRRRLTPYRTFMEADQVESDFILRIRKSKETGEPTIALFEADGGAWRALAQHNVAEKLKAELGSQFLVIE